MKRTYLVVSLVLLAFISFNCQREVKYDGLTTTTPTPATSTPGRITVQGNILDENGQPVSGVSVRAGDQTVTTDIHGYFRARNATVDMDAALVIAEKSGYFKGYRTFRATSGTNQVMIQLTKKVSAGDVDAASGGTATLSNGAKVALPANGIVLASNGTAYTGTVKVYAAYIDPTSPQISKTVPGSFMANDSHNSRVSLSSYGMLAVELETPAGVKLQVKTGSEATLTFPIPSSLQASAPASISLWYVDETTGLWMEQGSASKNGSNYVGNVKHFSFWNCDVSMASVNLAMTLKNTDGLPLVHAQVRLTRTSSTYLYSSYGWTDSLGQVNGLVPGNEPLLMEVLDPCGNAMYSHAIGPFSQATNIGVVTINDPGSHLVTIKGKVTNCAGAAITSGYALIYIDNMVRYASTDASGNFAIAFVNCSSSSPNFSIIGVDNTNSQQGSTVSVPVASPLTNAGTISACGISSASYINYTLDGTAYTIGPPTDTVIVQHDSLSNNNLNPALYVSGSGTGVSSNLVFSFAPTATGSWPLNYLGVQNYGGVNMTLPFNTTLTNFPQATGEFYEGNFSGQFKDNNNVTHTISATYRFRKSW